MNIYISKTLPSAIIPYNLYMIMQSPKCLYIMPII